VNCAHRSTERSDETFYTVGCLGVSSLMLRRFLPDLAPVENGGPSFVSRISGSPPAALSAKRQSNFKQAGRGRFGGGGPTILRPVTHPGRRKV
jgi:hypothetical protein